MCTEGDLLSRGFVEPKKFSKSQHLGTSWRVVAVDEKT
jgi:hypothetical protein